MMFCGLTMSWRPSELRIHELRSLALDLVLSSLSGILLVLSLPWFDLSFLAWIALVPLLVALEGKSLKEAFLLSYLTGLIFFPVVFSWILTADLMSSTIAFLPPSSHFMVGSSGLASIGSAGGLASP